MTDSDGGFPRPFRLLQSVFPDSQTRITLTSDATIGEKST